MKLVKALDESIFAIGTYYGIMWDERLWIGMFEDANASKDQAIKRRALDMEKTNISMVSLFHELVKLDKQRDTLMKIPFTSMIKDNYLNWKSLGYDAANDAFRLLLILRKINPRPIYNQKISFLKFLIDKNEPGRY